ncbi:suppressor of tub2 mutation [Thecaphora frezii]
MADPDYVYELTQRVHSTIDSDKKVAAVHALHEHLQQAGYVVEADLVTAALKTALRGSNQALSNSALSFLSLYVSLLYPVAPNTEHHEPQATINHNVRLLVSSITSSVLEKLGDQKERIREAARNVLVELGRAAYGVSGAQLASNGKGKEVESALGIFERLLREGGLAAKFARIREQAVLVLGPIRRLCEKYPVRPLLPTMVDLLADADPAVREASRTTLVSLFLNASPAAKAELKKELEKKGVRKQTMDAILKEVLVGGGPSAASASASAAVAAPPTPAGYMPVPRSAGAGAASQNPSSLRTSRGPGASALSAESSTAHAVLWRKGHLPGSDDIKPVYIASRSDLERTFQSFLPFFEGKETEKNWSQREQSIVKIRGMLKADIHRQFGEANFVAGVRLMQEGVLKALASLRTTLSMHAICLLAELPVEVGDDLAPCVEAFLSALMRMAGFTKKIVANATQEAASAIFVHVSYRHLFLQLIWFGLQEKNVATRTFAAEHLTIVLAVHASHRKHGIESHGGLDMLDKCLKRGLADANPEVRAKSRDAFWRFYAVWTGEAKVMFNALDAAARKQVMSTAPPGTDVEAATEAKPKTLGIPTRRPGGPSGAILAAKRAASAKAAQERERKMAEEAAAAHEARLAATAAAAAAATTPTTSSEPRPGPSARIALPFEGTPKAWRVVSSGVHRFGGGGHYGIPMSPSGSASRAEAAMIPLPTSPPVSLASTPRPRTISLVSQPSSAGSSSGPRSPTAYVSPRGPIQLQSLRQRAISTSSQGSAPTHMAISTSSNDFQPRRPSHADQNGNGSTSVRYDDDDEGDDDGDVTQQIPVGGVSGGGGERGGSVEEDETMQLPAPADESVDLMNFDSPFRLPQRSGPGGLGAAGHSALGDDSLAFLETPLARSMHRAVSTSSRSISTSQLAEETRSPSITSSPGTPGTAKKRSSLPRPVSMFHRGPSPLSSRVGAMTTAEGATDSEAGSSQDSPSTRHRVSKSVDVHAITTTITTTPTTMTPKALQGASPSSKENVGLDVNAAGVGGANGAAANEAARPHKWFLSRVARLENSATLCSPAKAKPESAEWVAELANGTADRRTFQRLLKLSSDFKVPRRAAAAEEEAEATLRPGRLASTTPVRNGAHGLTKMGEVEDGTPPDGSTVGAGVGLGDETDLAIELWQENDLFRRLFGAVLHYLLAGVTATGQGRYSRDLHLAALVLMHKLVDNQHPLLVACSLETEAVETWLTLRAACKVTDKAVQALEANVASWATRTDPVLGFTTVAKCLDAKLASISISQGKKGEEEEVGLFTIAMLALEKLVERLPSEVVEDLLPVSAETLYRAVHHRDPAVRQAGVRVLVAANRQMEGYEVVFKVLESVGEVGRDKMDLLAYYFHKDGGARS